MKYLNIPDLRVVFLQAAVWMIALGALAAYAAVGSDSLVSTISLGLVSGASVAAAVASVRMSMSLSDSDARPERMVLQPVRARDLEIRSDRQRSSRAA